MTQAAARILAGVRERLTAAPTADDPSGAGVRGGVAR
jgi:hypothetical protein